jgi:hypothetical protein
MHGNLSGADVADFHGPPYRKHPQAISATVMALA